MSRTQSLVKSAPWWVKMPAKLALRQFSRSQHFWRRFGVFQHGFMLDPEYAQGVFADHREMARPFIPQQDNYTVLEMGPGDSLATALLAAADGAKHSYLVDVDSAAATEMAPYQALAEKLRQPAEATHPERVPQFDDLEQMLQRCSSTYLPTGLKAWESIPDNSVDWVFSHAVLEHVWLETIDTTLAQTFRALKPGGVATHCIDLDDHFENSLHSLRIPEKLWESHAFRTSGFYTNRHRMSQWESAFARVGFVQKALRPVNWDSVPLPRAQLQGPYSDLTDEDLRAYTIYITVQKPA
jgi:SAM-dependent methyltransferase